METNSIPRVKTQCLLIGADPSYDVEEILDSQGYEVTVCRDGEAGWTRLKEGQVLVTLAVDLVLLDMQLPDMEALLLLQRIRMDARFALLPVLVLLDAADTRLQQQVFDLGASDYLLKPVRKAELLARVRAFFNGREAERAQQRRTERLIEAGKLILSTLHLEVVLRRILQIVVVELDVEGGSLWLPNAEGWLECKVAFEGDAERLVGFCLQPGAGIAGWVFKYGQMVLVPDVHSDPRFYQDVDSLMGFQNRDLLAFPIQGRGQPLGVLELVNRRHGPFSASDLTWLEALAPLAAAAIENARLYDQTCRDALHLRALLDNIRDEIVVVNRHLRITDVNAALLQKLDCRREDVIGRPYMEFSAALYPENGPSAPMLVERVLESGQTFHTLQLNGDPSAPQALISRVASPLYDARGEVDCVIETARDVTVEWEVQARLTAVHKLSSRLVQLPDVQGVADAVLDAALTLFHVPIAEVWVVDETSGEMRCLARRRLLEGGEPNPAREVPILLRQTHQRGEPIYVPDRHVPMRSALVLPLAAGGRGFGVLSLEHEFAEAFSDEDRRLGVTLAEVAGIGLSNQQLFQRERQTARYLRTLSLAVTQASVGLRAEAIMEAAAQTLIDECNLALACIWLVDPKTGELILRASAGPVQAPEDGQRRVPLDEFEHFTVQIIQASQPVITNRVLSDPGFDHEWAAGQGVVAFAGYPLQGEGTLQGVINVFSRQRLEIEILDVLGVFAHQVAIVLENATLFEAVNRRNEELTALHRISEIALASQPLATAFEQIVEVISQTTGFSGVAISLYHEDRQNISFEASRGIPFHTPGGIWEVPVSKTPSGSVVKTGQPLVTRQAQEWLSQHYPHLPSMGLSTLAIIPMAIEQRVIGTLSLGHREPIAIDDRWVQWVENMVNQISSLIERRRAEEILKEREALYRTLIETSPDAMVLMDLQLNLVLLNERAVQLYGYEGAAEMLQSGSNLLDLIVLEERLPAQEIARLTIEKEELREMQYTLQRKDGTCFPGELSTRVVLDSQRRPRAFAGTLRDITERKAAEAALTASEHRFRTLAETTTAAIFICHRSGEFIYVNSGAEVLTGYSREELLRINYWELVAPEHWELVRERDTVQPSPAEGVWRYELKLMNRAGEERWVDLVTTITELDGERVVLGTALDVTERKQAEETLRRREERFRSLIENAWDAVMILDANLQVCYASPSIKRVLGYDPTSVIGGNTLDTIHPEDVPVVLRQFQVLMQMPGNPCLIEARVRHRNGAWCIMEGIASNLLDNGSVSGFVVNFRDITVRKQARQTLLRINAAIESTSDAIGIADPGGVHRYHNRAFQELFGYSVEELNAIGGPRALYTDQRLADSFFDTLMRGDSWHGEVNVRARSGQIIPISLRADAIRDPSGAVVGLVGIHTDITEQKRVAERERRHARDLAFLSKTAMGFVELSLEEDIYEVIAVQLRQLVGNAVVLVAAFDPVTEEFQLRALQGVGKRYYSVLKLLRRDPIGMAIPLLDVAAQEQLFTGRLYQVPEGLYGVFFPQFSRPFCRKLEKMLKLGEVHEIGFVCKGKLLGDAVIIPRRGSPLINAELVETFISQASVALQRRLTEDALRESERRYRLLFNSSNDAAFVYGMEDGRVTSFVEVNDVACQRLGYRREDMLGMTPLEIEAPEIRSHVSTIWERLRTDHQILFETVYVTGAGERIPMEVNALLFELNGQPSVLSIARDITERKEAERERARFTAQLRAAAELAEQINAVLDPELLLQEVGRQLQARFALCYVALYLLDEDLLSLVRKAAWGYSDPESQETGCRISQDQHGCPIAQAAHFQEIVVCNDLELEGGYWLQRDMRAEVVVPLITHGRLLGVLDIQDTRPESFRSADLDVFSTLAGQIATALENARLFGEIQQTAERLQILSHRLVEVQEMERRTIARELHDEVGQILTGLKLVLDMGVRSGGEVDRGSLEEAKALVYELLERVRQMSLDLRPPMLDDLGLLPALLWHFERYMAQTHIQIQFRHTGLERRFPVQIETAGYRIVQEALTNVARHARVNEVTVLIWARDEALSVQVEDLGRGFDPELALASHNSSGISGIQERIRLLGGQFTLESAPGTGTRLTAELPLN